MLIYSTQVEMDIARFLDDDTRNSDMLLQVFVKYNISLPSSSPVETLFLFATLTDASQNFVH